MFLKFFCSFFIYIIVSFINTLNISLALFESLKIKLVIQSDVQGSFQGKDFILTEDWTMYTHTFNLKSKSKQNGVKFWFMTAGTTYLLDDVSISK